MYEYILPLIGFLIAIFAAISGIGGGVFFVPILTLAFGFAPSTAIGTSLLVMVFGGLGATIGYSRQKKVYFKAALLLAVAAAPGAVLGAYLTKFLPNATLGLTFATFLIALAIWIIYDKVYVAKRKKERILTRITCEADCFKNRKRLAFAFCLSFFAGAISGLLGIGGGTIIVPLLLLVVFLPVQIAVGTSMFLVLLTSLSGVLQHFTLGNINFTFALLLAVGAFIGAQTGAYFSKRIAAEKVQLILAIALIVVSAQMFLKFLM
jgi:uncharacterized membrane protein YfcA